MEDAAILYAVYQDRGPSRPPKLLAADKTEAQADQYLSAFRREYLNLKFFKAPYTPVSYGYLK